ncbi:MAG: 2-hydroxyacyl-CoA dehydratase [Oscillospiraceae bacterium]|jgi:predicted nucleotide-binding protein (sugar kinase/HSP70/actin superfamily)|nr:2-hydroxyacyl-CoA dehydratase [Oscillospiraceae bacterium]
MTRRDTPAGAVPLEYGKNGRLLFTKAMKREYTLLIPQMLPVTFALIRRVLELYGYKAEMLTTSHRGITDTGLKYVHNDTCYPALLVIGQLLDALQSGKYDAGRTALLISQTGGGCRASNYIHLLRKALRKAGLAHVPVISLNLSGLEKNPGFKLSLPILRRFAAAMIYGDFITWLAGRTKPYEVRRGATAELTERLTEEIAAMFGAGRAISRRGMRGMLGRIAGEFAAVGLEGEPKPRVGVVGEIYVKFAPLGNNNLEDFLLSEGCEVVVPGLTDFMIFKIDNRSADAEIYRGSRLKKLACDIFKKYIESLQDMMIAVIEERTPFRPPGRFGDLERLIKGYLGRGNKMGEGWLLTAEMLELIHTGADNIVCAQPFGCLPNHVAGKGMIRRLKDDFPESNIVAIDYDPGASRINQENRVKLMISAAKEKHRARGGNR